MDTYTNINRRNDFKKQGARPKAHVPGLKILGKSIVYSCINYHFPICCLSTHIIIGTSIIVARKTQTIVPLCTYIILYSGLFSKKIVSNKQSKSYFKELNPVHYDEFKINSVLV